MAYSMVGLFYLLEVPTSYPRFKNSDALNILNKFTYNIQDILNTVILDEMWIDAGM